MTERDRGAAAIACVIESYPALTPEVALAFLYICAEDGLSLKALSKRLGEGQSTVARLVAALERVGPGGIGLVVLSETVEGELRRTIRVSESGRALQAQVRLMTGSDT